MEWTTIRVPVPREFVVTAAPTEGDERPLTLIPRLMGRYPLVLGGHDLGDWYVQGIEVTMETHVLFTGDQRIHGLAETPHSVMPTYWATLTKAVG